MSDKNTSTLQSVIDNVSGTAQSVLGSITGSDADKRESEAKQTKAQAENDASHAAVSGLGMSASSSGAVTKNDPNRSDGSWNQTVGSGKEMVGNLVGSESLKREGQQQNAEGKAQEAAGQVNDFVTGISNRVSGAVNGAVAGVTGDREAQTDAQNRHDIGKTQQRGAEHDIQKQNY